ncbi:hypothetical protein GJ689_08380 [Rhodoplanes serenus]|uniref:Uncharacterized protein n=1 Tax=Rhodoplanes serenus TaxID=200615 RepID=A0A3S4BWS5_9BRAD|nr:hypothetical protein [Rhodoplanes serenus]MTW16224.1 hypothetical protein [Rhodoplanes serenus]VCU09324.1 hypothetical protein RHODGE_RHODGE_02498 [Rhodoplanes serenus]
MTLVLLRQIRAKQDEQSQILADHTRRFDHLEKRLEDMSKVARYSLDRRPKRNSGRPSRKNASTRCSTSSSSS